MIRHLLYRTTFSSPRGLQKRCYALSRFSERNPGVRRTQKRYPASGRYPASPASDGLRQLLSRSNTLVIERQIEMLNVFVGFEQSNKYTISGEEGEPLGYIAEDSKGFLGTLSRQFFATHRPFRAVILDTEGNPVLFLRRPFAWINSRMFVQRRKDRIDHESDAEPALDTFGEVQQIWHPWRRRYDLFLGEPIAAPAQGRNPKPTFYQVAKVDAGFVAWHFGLIDESGNVIARIDRAFRGIGRELFTDTGKYSLHFVAPTDLVNDLPVKLASESEQPHLAREVSLDERAIFLALAVNIDFDYFSRHSHGGGGILHFPSWD